ncbi:MAG: hypothetical protein FJZ11_06885, partial [Candidatus Omnitrophica bacterium]|nr:hypothetical protein [Candidatus Omnitrophota bacterium]
MITFLSWKNISKNLTSTAVGWFVFACLAHLFSLRPLWWDENAVFRSIKELSPAQIFGPLLAAQVFPRFYLFFIQDIARVFDYHLLSLRILPFAAMTGSFFIWLKIYKQEGLERLQHLLIIFSWCASYYLIYYSAELKQYSGDVFVAAIFTLFLYKQRQFGQDKQIALCEKLSILLPILLLFSYIGYLFVWIPLYNYLLSIKNNKKNFNLVIFYSISLILFVFFSYYFDIRFYKGHMQEYFNDYFISLKSPAEFLKNFTEGTNNLLSCWFSEVRIIKKFARFFAVFGLYAIFHFFIINFRKEKFRIYSASCLSFV